MLSKTAQTSTQLVLLLARFPYNEETKTTVISLVEKEKINWEEVFNIALKHKVAMIVYNRIQSLPPFLVPKKTQESFRVYCKEKLFSNLLKAKELLILIQQFKAKDVFIVPYKGVVFSQEMYGNISLRSFSDIDFWYRKEDTPIIKAVLKENGYKSVPEYSVLQEYFFNKINCEYHFIKNINKQRILIEPHYWLANHFIRVNPNEKHLEKNRQIVLQNQDISIFSIEMTFLYIVSHHGTTTNWALIKHHLDVASFIQKHFKADWSEILKLCDEFKLKEVALVGILNTKKLFTIELPNVLEEAIKDKSIDRLSNLSLRYSFDIKEKWYSTFYKIWFLIQTRKGIKTKTFLFIRIIQYSFFRFIFESLMFFKRLG